MPIHQPALPIHQPGIPNHQLGILIDPPRLAVASEDEDEEVQAKAVAARRKFSLKKGDNDAAVDESKDDMEAAPVDCRAPHPAELVAAQGGGDVTDHTFEKRRLVVVPNRPQVTARLHSKRTPRICICLGLSVSDCSLTFKTHTYIRIWYN
jgi:hypothetical protein